MKNWQSDVSSPLVSICCATYNHKDYIAAAIDGFLMQDTEFPFEILIHDDASDDGTTEIVEAYARSYPRIIRTIIQKHNQYVRSPVIVPRFLFPLVRGKYIAICEGDDHWLSPDKLTRQCGALDRNPLVDLSFHPVLKLGKSGNTSGTNVKGRTTQERIDRRRIILGGGGFCPTPSIVLRSSLIPSIMSCVAEAPVGDKFIQIVASLSQGAMFDPNTMAVYRTEHQGSWSQRINDGDMLRRYEERIEFPYKWLYSNCDESLQGIVRFSEADQYVAIGKKYSQIGDYKSAGRVLMKSAAIWSPKRPFSWLVRWAARGPVRTKVYLALYPVVRTVHRYSNLYGNRLGRGQAVIL